MESRFENIRIFASSAGEMTVQHMRIMIQGVLGPVGRRDNLQQEPSIDEPVAGPSH